MRGVVTLLALAGCVAAPAPDAARGCDPADHSALVGRAATSVAFPPGLEVRIFAPGDLGTADFVPDRLNVFTGADGIVERVTCG